MQNKAIGSAIFLFFFLFLPQIVFAQFGASLQGTITDSTGGVIPNATVTLTNNETARQLTATASADGFYRFTGLAPGSYNVAAEAPNFTGQQISGIAIQAEQTQGVNITLQAGAVHESVTVTDQAANLVQTENAQIGGQITTREVTSLPQFGRNPYELLRLSPN